MVGIVVFSRSVSNIVFVLIVSIVGKDRRKMKVTKLLYLFSGSAMIINDHFGLGRERGTGPQFLPRCPTFVATYELLIHPES